MKNTMLRLEEQQRNISIHIQPSWKTLTKSRQNCCLSRWMLKSFKTLKKYRQFGQKFEQDRDQNEQYSIVDDWYEA